MFLSFLWAWMLLVGRLLSLFTGKASCLPLPATSLGCSAGVSLAVSELLESDSG